MTASSAGEIEGWLSGSLRKNQIHTSTQTKLAAPSTKNEPRQEVTTMNAAISGGVNALPIRANECVMPCGNPQRSGGFQIAMARGAVGNAAASPMTGASSAANSEDSTPSRPVAAVEAHMI